MAEPTPSLAAQRPPGERGDLKVHDRAVARIIEHAATTVPGAVTNTQTLDRLRGRRSHPHADVRIQGSRAWVDLAVAATWPCRANELVESVRETVLEQAGRLSGLDIARIDVHLQFVETDGTAETRRVR